MIPNPNARGMALVNLWAARLGFHGWRIVVSELPERKRRKHWALCYFDADEEWATIELVPDNMLPEDQLEWVIVHEFAHGLITLAGDGGKAEEQVCNRVARAILGADRKSPNEWREFENGGADYSPCNRPSFDPKPWLGVLVDALPPEDRALLTAVYWEGRAPHAIARERGVHQDVVHRELREAQRRLFDAFTALEQVTDG